MSTAGATLDRRHRFSPAAETDGRGGPSRGLALSRLILPLACLVFAGMLTCAFLGYIWARQTESGRDADQRLKLRAAIEESRPAFSAESGPAPATMRAVERAAGVKELRFDPEPGGQGRETQTLVDPNGRIIGWLSWSPDRPATDLLDRLWPLVAASFLGLVIFMSLAVWQLRRAARALADNATAARKAADDDPLTGLPHHSAMLGLLDRALAARRHSEVGVFGHIGLDGFKEINGTLGHAMGDEVLAAVAERLRAVLPEGAIAGRFGGDEFAVFATAPDEERAVAAIQTLSAALMRPYWVRNRAVQIGVSAGVALAPRDGAGSDELTRRAHLALHSAKDKKRGQVVVFEAAMDFEYSDRHFIERELKRALAAEDLTLHYQPIVAANGSHLVGVEALLRWVHPDRGNIPPLTFVAVAERAGLMPELGQFVLRRALADAQRWPSLTIAVNLSPVQVRDPALVDIVARDLRDSGIAPERLLLEVTEGVLIDNPAEAKERLDALRALGVKLALDDFGTGYSSLGYLQNFKFDKLKIDKSFVQPLGRSGNSAAMIQAIVALGRALGMTVLVEGVETEEQRVLLRLAGCDEMQGFLFAKPMPREGIDSLLIAARLQALKAASRQA